MVVEFSLYENTIEKGLFGIKKQILIIFHINQTICVNLLNFIIAKSFIFVHCFVKTLQFLFYYVGLML